MGNLAQTGGEYLRTTIPEMQKGRGKRERATFVRRVRDTLALLGIAVTAGILIGNAVLSNAGNNSVTRYIFSQETATPTLTRASAIIRTLTPVAVPTSRTVGRGN